MTVPNATGAALLRLVRFLEQEGGGLHVHRTVTGQGRSPGWTVGIEFGQEDPDSDMAAGASYAAETDLLVALNKIATEIRA